MSMTEKMPDRRCMEYVSAGITSYPCWLTFGHDGPHVAVEVPATATRRAVWEAEQKLAGDRPSVNPLTAKVGTAPNQASFDAVPKPPPFLDPAAVVDGAEREARAMETLVTALRAADVSGLPEWARQGLVGSAALTTLGVLWVLAQNEFEGGAQSVVLSKEFLERAVTPSLRAYLTALRRQDPQ